MEEGEAVPGRRRLTVGTALGLGTPLATIVALVLSRLGLRFGTTWFFCLLSLAVVIGAVALHRGVRGPDRSPLDRRP